MKKEAYNPKEVDNQNNEKLTVDELMIYNTIKNSKTKYITREKILNILGYPQSDSNDRKVRSIVNKLITQHNLGIGSSYIKSQRGYYIIRNEEDKQQAIKSLRNLHKGLLERLEALENLKF
ncbi:pathogenicity island protein [Staphylococcus chromogenes]|uniref:pathogenicity island protein n=1 Tax=Staphylococcus chromogenes TaxID=46126 RepID=UPI000E68E117|nr:pathogenicity island protein [Staphylococcus chromogenes]RIM16825.1 pathogenicity island protein [Staphylococcus chromogenes]